MTVHVRLPGALAELTGGSRRLELDLPTGTVAELLDAIAADYPVLARRLRDETGGLRRYVNVFVDGTDVRAVQGLGTPVHDDAVVDVLPSVAGG